MKKIINEIEDIVDEMCCGLVAADPDLILDERYRVIQRRKIDRNKVSLVAGGGGGHEPSHAGFVGEGMLTAAVTGEVFTAPSMIQIYNAILRTESSKGTLLIVKNFESDTESFNAAAELAAEDGITIECVYVNDDIAVRDNSGPRGGRGLAGTLFVHKIAGAAAERGYELAEVKRIAQKVVTNVRSIGFAFAACTVPAKGTPSFRLGKDEIECGVGIHGEPGIARWKYQNSAALAAKLCGKLQSELKFKWGEDCALMINGLGATPLMELYVLNNDVSRWLQENGIRVYRTMVGNYMTSLDTEGASITLLRLDEELKELLDEPTKVRLWR